MTPGAGSEQVPALASLSAAANPTEDAAAYSRSDLAAAAAQLAQQALEARRSSAGRPVFEIYSVTEGAPTPRYDSPDADDEMTICALTLPDVAAIGPPSGDLEEVWALYDSGSGLTTCPADCFVDVDFIVGTHPCKLEAATGDAVRAIGRRRVHFLDEAAEHLAIDFTVTNVTKIIIAADALDGWQPCRAKTLTSSTRSGAASPCTGSAARSG